MQRIGLGLSNKIAVDETAPIRLDPVSQFQP
jgi:hypothetical protein